MRLSIGRGAGESQKPCQMHCRSYKNRCWRCLWKSFAENAYNMRPGSAVRSKCEPVCSVFEVLIARLRARKCGLASVWRRPGELLSQKPQQMQRRSYKNRCWRCLCKSFAESAYKMGPGSAVRSKCEPLCSGFGGLGVPGANEYLRFGVDRGRGRAKNLDKCRVGPTKIDVGGVCLSRLPKMLTRWGLEMP